MNKNLFQNINEQNDKINEQNKKDDILDIYKNKNNQNEEEKQNRVIPQRVYDQIDKRDLKTVIVCMQKCNEKYEEALKLIQNALYFQSLNLLVQSRNSYMRLKNAIQQRPESY